MENENLDKFLVCEAPRYKDTRAQGKKILHKVALLPVDTETKEIIHVRPKS